MKTASSSRAQAGSSSLSGVRVLVGRARHQAGALSSALRELGAEVIEIPFIEIRKAKSFKALDSSLNNLKSYDWLILTSVNGVEAMWDRMEKLRIAQRDLTDLRVAAIGPATKRAIAQHGVKVDVVPKEYIAESVVRSLRGRVKGKRVLLVRAKVARDVIPHELRKAGAYVDVVEAYETVVPSSSRSRLGAALNNPSKRPHVVTFSSSSTVRNFVKLVGSRRAVSTLSAGRERERRPRASTEIIRTASIGPVTSSTLRELGLPVDIAAREFTISGLVEAIARSPWLSKPRLA
jgi:uroporphyrinogen-III synthase